MAKRFNTLDDIDTKGKTVLLRIDINSTIDLENKKIMGKERFRQVVPTINELGKCKLVLLAHQSRPGRRDCTKLKLHRNVLEEVLGRKVKYVEDLIGAEARRGIMELEIGEILLLENTRLYSEEIAYNGVSSKISSTSHIVQNIAPLVDFFVIDSFAAAHRSQPSLTGFMEVLPSAAGRLMERELKAINGMVSGTKGPMCIVLGGAKFEDSISIAKYMLTNKKADKILVCGLVAHIFFLANDIKIGKRNLKLLEKREPNLENYVEMAKNLIYSHPYNIYLPDTVAVEKDGKREETYIDNIPENLLIKDIGQEALELFIDEIKMCSSIILNGPAGVFEEEEFGKGTRELLTVATSKNLYSMAGGGETTTAIEKYGLADGIDHISTGGGATMCYLAGKNMPVVDKLEKNLLLFN